METNNKYKVVLIFDLIKNSANEELKRSKEEHSFPMLLRNQKGFIEMELVKINEEKTMSIQTWKSEADWWNALNIVKEMRENLKIEEGRENILVNREFLTGTIQMKINL